MDDTPSPPTVLVTEEFEVVQRQLRGNLPQAMVHASLIESSHVLAAEHPHQTV